MSFAQDLDLEQRLGGLFPIATDPRVSWLPDKPSAAEAHLRPGGTCDLVVGYSAERLAEFDAFVTRCLGHAVETAQPDHRAMWRAWLGAAGERIDVGAQLAAYPGQMQLYLRGHFSPEIVQRACAAVGCESSSLVIANALSLMSVASADMIGLEITDSAIHPAVYLMVHNRSRDDAAAILDLVAFLLSALLPGTSAHRAWRAIAPELLIAPVMEEWVYISFEPTLQPRWVKIDVGQRPLALVAATAARLEADVAPMMAIATARGFDPITHLGVRFGGAVPAVSIYYSLV